MPEADRLPTTDRRTLLTLPLSLIPMRSAAPAGADRALIVLCHEFDRIERIIQHTHNAAFTRAEEDAAEAFTTPLYQRQREMLVQFEALEAKTLAGLRARAASLKLWGGDGPIDADGSMRDRLLAPLIRDLIAGG